VISARETPTPPPPPDSLGARLLVAVPAECPAALAAKIEAHNRDVADWQSRLDRLDVDVATLRNVSRERGATHETIMAAIAVLDAERKAVFAQFRELLDDRMVLVKELYDRGVEDRAPIIAAVQKMLRASGWPWRGPVGYG
jgi:hypothetical protein